MKQRRFEKIKKRKWSEQTKEEIDRHSNSLSYEAKKAFYLWSKKKGKRIRKALAKLPTLD